MYNTLLVSPKSLSSWQSSHKRLASHVASFKCQIEGKRDSLIGG